MADDQAKSCPQTTRFQGKLLNRSENSPKSDAPLGTKSPPRSLPKKRKDKDAVHQAEKPIMKCKKGNKEELGCMMQHSQLTLVGL